MDVIKDIERYNKIQRAIDNTVESSSDNKEMKITLIIQDIYFFKHTDIEFLENKLEELESYLEEDSKGEKDE